MFERVEIAQPSHKTATTVAFLINTSVIALAIVIPMLRPDVLPAVANLHISVPYSRPVSVVADTPRPDTSHFRAIPVNTNAFTYPGRVPKLTDMSADSTNSSDPGPAGPIGIGPTGNGIPNTLLIGTNPPPIDIAKPAAPTKPLVLSHLDEGFLIRKVQPVYPAIAKATRTQGEVQLTALIDVRGEIVGLRVVNGSPLLAGAAMDAVRQWRYKPYLLNGSPVEVQTDITVVFHLQ